MACQPIVHRLADQGIVDERVLADGGVEKIPDLSAVRPLLQQALDDGFHAVAIGFMHAYRYPAHEQAVAKLAREIKIIQCLRHQQISVGIKTI